MNDFLSRRARGEETARPGIMVVDDDAGVLAMLDEWLRRKGFSVWLAATGEDALEVYSRHNDTIDVVLMDVCMPGLDGPETLAGLKAINPQVCCCFMSGDLGGHSEAELLDRGGAAFVSKPFRPDDLARSLSSLVRPRTLKSETV
jgi:CheY-like chemotaxis protein